MKTQNKSRPADIIRYQTPIDYILYHDEIMETIEKESRDPLSGVEWLYLKVFYIGYIAGIRRERYLRTLNKKERRAAKR